MGAMLGYAGSYLSGSPWYGVLAAALGGVVLGALHGWMAGRPRVNDIALGIALMLFATGLAFFLGKPFIQPQAPQLPSLSLGWWSELTQVQAALRINALFLAGLILVPLLKWFLERTRWGLVLRTVGESQNAADALGFNANRVRLLATMAGGVLAGIGGSFLSLYYPGSWNEALSSGQGLMAVALVIFARWDPVRCFYAALLFGGAGALGPALQSAGISGGYYLFNAAPYILTLALMMYTSSPRGAMVGAPGELSINR